MSAQVRARRFNANKKIRLSGEKYVEFSHSYKLVSMKVYVGKPGNLKLVAHKCREVAY